VPKGFSNTINPGEKLRLRDDVLPLVKKRSWVFGGMGNQDTIIPGHEGTGYVWEAKPDHIDWKEYKKKERFRLTVGIGIDRKGPKEWQLLDRN